MDSNNVDRNELIKDSSGRNSTLHLVILVAALCFALAAFVIAIVSLSQQNGSSSPSVVNVGTGLTSKDDRNDDKVWMIHVGHTSNNAFYLDEETGQVAGFVPDMVNAVCRVANKNCALIFDVFTNCWNSEIGEVPRGGVGLFSGWYDGCAGWRVKKERQRTFKFSDPFTKSPHQAFGTLKDNPNNFNWQDITGKKIGFIDGTSGNEQCLAKADGIVGAAVPPENVVHCTHLDDCYLKLMDGTIDAIFSDASWVRGSDVVEEVTDRLQACTLGGFGMMTRFDNNLIDSWWAPAQEKLLASKEYHEICNDVKIAHGHIPGYDPIDFCIGL
ncbi:arginine-binding periplasmic protein-like [Amphiura filiformis]|uniref:arginine-binding periplasmic protein-like n=1 Tax=Amphiura filiformis TaxID=82378 RepID=UPI003B225805